MSDADDRLPLLGGLEPEAVERLERYVALLLRWNERHNLTGFRTRDQVLRRGIEDSLTALSLVPRGGDVLDVGSGAGFPAIPMAVVDSGRCWILLEPRRKRAAFLNEACRVLELSHVEVRQERLQQYAGSLHHVTSRAVGGLTALVASRLAPGNSWIRAMSSEEAACFTHPLLHLPSPTPSPIPGQCWVRIERGGDG